MIGLEDTVVAVTNGRDFHLLHSTPRSLSNLPNEMLSMILKLLEKDQLKSVRCTCKLFETMVSPLLFDKIYISPHQKNLDVFRQITEHSDLCRYPRELVYDIQKFKANIDPGEYYKELCNQIRYSFRNQSRSSFHHADKDIEGLVRMTCGIPREDADYSTCRVVKRGLEIYREKVEEEDHYNNSGQLLACLCVGLMKLPYVHKVHFQSLWKYHHLYSVDWSNGPRDMRIFSSPLARAWSPFHLRPKSPFVASTDHELDNVISAFSFTKKPLRFLDVGFLANVSYENFYSGSHLSRTFCQHSRVALYHLKSLILQVFMRHHSADGDGFTEEKTLSVDLLADALLHMPGLRLLSLSGTIQDDGNGLLSFNELFKAVRLPALDILRLGGMLGSAAGILAFLRANPRLRKLGLSGIELSEGSWVGLVDDMRRWLQLESVSLELPLRQEGGVDLWDEDSWTAHDMSGDIEYYVRYGGDNPLRARG